MDHSLCAGGVHHAGRCGVLPGACWAPWAFDSMWVVYGLRDPAGQRHSREKSPKRASFRMLFGAPKALHGW